MWVLPWSDIYEPFSQGDVTSHLPDFQLVTDLLIEKKINASGNRVPWHI